MRRSNTQSLGDALRDYIREMNMDHKLKEVDVIQSWEKLMGKTISHYTTNLYISKGVLYIKVNSSVVKNELIMLREEIRNKMNEMAGEEIVKKIVFK